MPLRPNMEPVEFLNILLRRKWMILYSILLILLGAMIYCVLVPDLYQSTVKILIIPPAVGEGMVRSTLNVGTRDRLMFIQQDVLSRARLKALIDEMRLFPDDRKDMSEDAMVGVMQKRIFMAIDRNNIFNLSFDYENPKVARDVASRLAAFVIDENIKSRGAATQETTKFLLSQVEETRKKLEEQEEKIKRYKLQFGGELPQQMQANLSTLSRLQDKIKNNTDAIARLEDRKVYIESQISMLKSQLRGPENIPGTGGVASVDENDPAWPLVAELAKRRQRLQDLGTKYTQFHPTVVQAQQEVSQLEKQILKLRQAAGPGNADPSDQKSARLRQPAQDSKIRENLEGGELQRLREQVDNIDLEVTALKRENADTVRMINVIQLKVERLPQREQEMISLSRDYENIKKSYEGLLQKRLEAGISENLEEKQKGERFQILESANLPVKPYKPDRLKLLGLALMASLVIGAGGSIGLEMLDPTLRGAREFKSFFDLPVLASLPLIQDDRYKRRIAVRRLAVIGGLVSIMGAYLVFLMIHGERVKMILHSIGGGN